MQRSKPSDSENDEFVRSALKQPRSNCIPAEEVIRKLEKMLADAKKKRALIKP
jgi:hypothetical protein